MRAPSVPTATDQLIRYGGEFADVIVERADGSWLTTEDGRRILDFTSGQMCATLGHGHPAVVEALRESSGRVVHLFSGFLSRDVLELARELMAVLPEPLARAMFLSTGGEANEAALRLAKLCTGGHEVLGFAGSWHGLTAGAGSSTYSAGRRGYGPGMPGAMVLPAPTPYRCPIRHCRDRCDLACLDAGMALADAQSAGAPAAVIAEPVLSVAGIVPLPDGYLAALKRRCEERGMLLILDEAQTGLGRVGALFAFERDGVVPDVLTLSKTLGGGLPLSATVTTAAIEEEAAEKGFLHFTSHVSDPLPAAVGRAVLRTVLAEGLAARAAELGARLRAGLEELARRHEPVGDVRGRGLMQGVELVT
ncbi:MAG TPA: aspartate aminotransferase family protein, partial [Solirubrobacteraceae bacterium]|nr:aspartate aminotransferase family protein [Solirubrobacteraceae bacterium]